MTEENPYTPPVADPSIAPQRQSLPEMDTPSLKVLRNDSHTIRALGALSVLAAIVGPMIILFAPQEESPGLAYAIGGGFFLFFGLVSYCSWWRPSWGRIPGILYCALALFSFPIGTIIGILGIISYARGGPLFGPDRYPHSVLDAEWKYRKRHGVN